MFSKEARKTKSQSALPQRKWSSSTNYSYGLNTAKTSSRTNVTTAVSDTHTGLQQKHSNTEQQRPCSAVRPSSAVRPLSGRVFMRCSSKHGWVAKAYPEAGSSSSQPNLENFGSLDCESLDSFFDDEFEDENGREQLGNLLSCNTLGVETRAMKQDWISGEVDIPRFHCPRCRDHWYGISSFPCDEELARLIREGLWHTGNNEEKDINKKNRSRSSSMKKSSGNERDFNLGSGLLPDIKQKSKNMSSKNNLRESSSVKLQRGEEDAGSSQRKKRISFKIDTESDSHSAKKELENGEGTNSGSRHTSKLPLTSAELADGTSSDGVHAGTGRSTGSSSARGETGSGERGGEGGDRGTATTGDFRRKGGSKDGPGGTDQHAGTEVTGGRDTNGRSRGKWSTTSNGDKSIENRDLLNGQNASELNGSKYNTGSGGARAARGGYGDHRSGVEDSGGHNQRDMGSVGTGKTALHSEGSQHSSTLGNSSGLDQDQGSGDPQQSNGALGTEHKAESSSKNRNHSLKSSETGSKEDSSNDHSNSGGKNQVTDFGRKVRKSGGYMRAVSPSSSEWGDPLHARSFISSTAMSRTGSSSNLLEDEDKGNNPNSSRKFLPPIVHPIHRQEDTSMLFLGGPQFTRAWTFSYHTT